MVKIPPALYILHVWLLQAEAFNPEVAEVQIPGFKNTAVKAEE